MTTTTNALRSLGLIAVAAAVCSGALAVARPAVATTVNGGSSSPDTIEYTVNSAADPGSLGCSSAECTLREAIEAANADLAPSRITFALPEGARTIAPVQGLPTITAPVTIDGTSQSPDATAKPEIELSGTLAVGAAGLRITAPDSLVRGLTINLFATGVLIWGRDATGNTIEGNHIGTDPAGAAARPSSVLGAGVHIHEAPANRITGNVISGNGNDGVRLFGPGATGNVIDGNRIGTDAQGTDPLPNGGAGIRIENAPSNTVGGTVPGAGNVISANAHGVWITERGASGNRILGNRIGTDAEGTGMVGNAGSGVWISDAPDNVVGGTVDGARNVIAGNRDGVTISGTEASGNVVQGNNIGADPAGEPLGNAASGVWISGAASNVVGGATEAGNLIAANRDGVLISASGAHGNVVRSNRIRGNRQAGVLVGAHEVTDVRANSIHANGTLGIDRAPVGVDPAPLVITEVGSSGSGAMLVRGTLTETSTATRVIELFASPDCDASGHGEGNRFLGATTIEAGGSAFAASVPPTDGVLTLTATVTDGAGDTSEFSACTPIPPLVSIDDVVLPEGDAGPTPFAFTVSLSRPSGAPVTVAFETASGSADPTDYESTSGTLTFAPQEVSKALVVLVAGDPKVEGDETFTVELTHAAGAVIAEVRGTATIVDDDRNLDPRCTPPERRTCRS